MKISRNDLEAKVDTINSFINRKLAIKKITGGWACVDEREQFVFKIGKPFKAETLWYMLDAVIRGIALYNKSRKIES